ncbi:MAG: D-alanyl-D-alanine carboxypeptidase/D-alanyl-D-alanine-endopeptidase [Gammaproteobacteria bacterium]|nr:D-alanyl-D-alanine carboxypeptidase/D-alanyl-D-alanine-endopeptidase [Rhodocyclaceae bacterium]MBU3910613.1 D-alanyl-D-alanine carboxypeptidase/D-alanyl-D-alanine-endopeptidase [Gammaproteobacteria bacterium]MBU3988306.1 D-alanyl-D-alanine carboxypeptidase/D-alanyl-D-alanine-endopeptidase [Gammaproteobacteria bacterium]MBU4005094.1 D-alanyl-D-alanine carboxypeptidase/D-alanyl-D-alanine-endopeptidase [Gammaproteobacteria bacterium]MBU4020687.1 D-alanyl-D-alanine carboxypeptidase/D-alanyl-D-al
MRRLCAIIFACCCLTASSAFASGQLPPGVVQALTTVGIPLQAATIVVREIDSGKTTLGHRADASMNPASLMKLLTTLAALEILGPAYTWRTELLAAGQPVNGVIEGGLYLRGSGDPKLTYDRLWLLLRELRGRGVKEIRGDLLLDRSAFAPVEHDPAAFDGKSLRPYNVGPDALLFNFATLHLNLLPETTAVRILAEPLPAGVEIVNKLQLSDAKTCGEWRERLEARLTPGKVELSGAFPRSCGERRWHLAGLPNSLLLHGVFTRLWRELGGEFSGQVRERGVPPNAVLLAASESPALGELVRDINKYSNNVMARQLFLKVGAGETAAADSVVRAWLAQNNLNFPELVIDNGAGLSRRERISADSLARLLATGWASPVMPEFVSSLPIAAIDGTAKKKFNGNGVAGRAHLKTGSLEGVRGIAGYLLDKNGRRHIVVFMVNHTKAGEAQPAFDALLEWLWSASGSRT